jgi:hypothetical protein
VNDNHSGDKRGVPTVSDDAVTAGHFGQRVFAADWIAGLRAGTERARAAASARLGQVRRRKGTGRRQPQAFRGPEHPPACPPGWLIGPPDFVGVGVQRAGTSWWHQLVCAHPQVLDDAPKELHYFQRHWTGEFDETDVETYRRFFARPPGRVVGEWTPRYLLDDFTPGQLHRAAPEARLMVILRDPVERYRSGMSYHQLRNSAQHSRFVVEAVARGHYATQLDRLREHFSRQQILVLQYERCIADPANQLNRTYAFLGLDPSFVPEGLTTRVNATESPQVPMGTERRDELRRGYEDGVRRLTEQWPEIDVALWPNFRHLAD